MADAKVEPFADTIELRRAVLQTCQAMCKLGYFLGTWGNISARVADGVLITPTRVDYDTMRPEDLVVVSWEGARLRGERLPSSEMHLHSAVLRHRPDLAVLIHSHSPWASSVACARMTIPPIADDMAQIIGGEVACSRYVPGGRHTELAEAAVSAMGTEAAAVLLANHGVLVGGRSLDEALVASQVLEKSAMMYVLATALGSCTIIPAQSVGEERYRYLFKYGTAADAEQHGSSGG